jgi:hypothetical protein
MRTGDCASSVQGGRIGRGGGFGSALCGDVDESTSGFTPAEAVAEDDAGGMTESAE